MSHNIFHLVFFIVLFSILAQGTLLPQVASLFKMTDSTSDVMKTFTDYTADNPVRFIRFRVRDGDTLVINDASHVKEAWESSDAEI